MNSSIGRSPRFAVIAVASLATVLCACVTPPPPRPVVVQPPPPRTDIYAYPSQGQTPEQQDRDRYDCYQWAIQQTGLIQARPTFRRMTVSRSWVGRRPYPRARESRPVL